MIFLSLKPLQKKVITKQQCFDIKISPSLLSSLASSLEALNAKALGAFFFSFLFLSLGFGTSKRLRKRFSAAPGRFYVPRKTGVFTSSLFLVHFGNVKGTVHRTYRMEDRLGPLFSFPVIRAEFCPLLC